MRRRHLIWLVILWTSAIVFSFTWNYSLIIANNNKVVLNKSQAFFKQLLITRAWNTHHGGVYVPISKTSPPNPYLKDSLRDVVTTEGVHLTKINPAYMTRQISELNQGKYDIRFNVTSLNPIRPENQADDWETKALQLFEQGTPEILELIKNDSSAQYRYMAPLITEKGCVKCHARQGYQYGDIRGGISVSFPSSLYLVGVRKQLTTFLINHTLILMAGILGLFVYFRMTIKYYFIIKKENLERKKSDIALRESEERFRLLANITVEGIAIHNEGLFVDANLPFCRMFGYTLDELKGKNLIRLLINEKHHELVFENAIKGVEDEYQVEGVKKTGEIFPIDIVARSILWNGEPARVASVRDITKRKQVEYELEQYRNHLEELVKSRTNELNKVNENLRETNNAISKKNEEILNQKAVLESTLAKLKETQSQLIQSEKMASLGVLTAGVAHEINNPLNYIQTGIYGLENMIEKGIMKSSMPERQEKILNNMQLGIERTAKIVTSLNMFSQKGDAKIASIKIHEIIDTSLVILSHELKGKCQVYKDYSKDQFNFEGNHESFHQVFVNLLMNAIQAIEGEGLISIITSLIKEKNVLQIKISDDGVGISKENLKKILDPFFTTKAPGKGTGLGLSIVYKIIEEHKGSIQFLSEPQKGTDVIIELPINKNYEK